ncbi:MAG: hypothetical protein CMJ59_24890 [Planctomycetaceae bacterium]|nr:hypothetical protein [Planctomycetaceae bacterium]
MAVGAHHLKVLTVFFILPLEHAETAVRGALELEVFTLGGFHRERDVGGAHRDILFPYVGLA